MRWEGASGTQVELCAATSFYQLPFYVFSPHPTMKQYRGLLFNPLDCAQLTFEAGDTHEKPALTATLSFATHMLITSTRVISIDKLIPTSPPQLKNTTSTMSVVYFSTCCLQDTGSVETSVHSNIDRLPRWAWQLSASPEGHVTIIVLFYVGQKAISLSTP